MNYEGIDEPASIAMALTCLIMSQVLDAQDGVLVEVREVLDFGKLRVLLHVRPGKYTYR